MIFNVVLYIKIPILEILAIYNQDRKMILLTVLMNIYITDYFISMNIFFFIILYFLYNIDSEKQKKIEMKCKFMIICKYKTIIHKT